MKVNRENLSKTQRENRNTRERERVREREGIVERKGDIQIMREKLSKVTEEEKERGKERERC